MHDGMIQSDKAAVIQPTVVLTPESWLAKISFVNHLILFNNVLITVLSEKEGGKTTFASLLQDNLDSQIKLLSMSVKAPCNRQDIISDIATQFHLKFDEHTDVSSIVAQINERKSHVLLMIDDAQHLPEIFIKEVLLAIKGQENFNYFHLCLVSDYSVVATLNNLTASFFDNLVHTIEIGPLNESETRSYVSQRALAARLVTKSLTDAQFRQFYQLTKGNVAKINSGLESFIFNCSKKKKNNIMDLVKKASVPAAAALISGVSCLFFAKAYYQNPEVSTVQAPSVAAVARAPEVLPSQIASWQEASTHRLLSHTLAKKQDLDVLAQKDVVAIADKAVVSAKVNSIQQGLVVPHQLAQSQQSNTSAVAPKLYTIQLVASPEKVDMERFKKINNSLIRHAKLSHYLEKKEVWYVLTLGEYHSIADAQKEIDKLPRTLTRLNPWVRPVSSLG